MSRKTGCVYLTCDRCNHGEYYDYVGFASNAGWGLEIKIPDEKCMDLCPKCYEKLGNLLHDYLYGDEE